MTVNVINSIERGRQATVYLTADGKLMRDAGSKEPLFCMSFTHRKNGSVAVSLEHASGVAVWQELGACRCNRTAFPKSGKQVLSAWDRIAGQWIFSVGDTGAEISVSNANGMMVIRHLPGEPAPEDQRAEDVEGVLLTLARGQRSMREVVASACH